MVLSILVSAAQNVQATLTPIILLGLLYLSMIRKWTKLKDTEHTKAVVSAAVHAAAMVGMVGLIVFMLAVSFSAQG